MKILVVSDYSMEKLGGAQVIAAIIRDWLGDSGHEAIFLEYPQSRIQTFNPILQSVKSLFNPYGVFLMMKMQRKHQPDLVWYHGINNEWSWTSLRVGKRSLRKLLTIHDLTAISNYKITPEFLNKIISESGIKKISRNLRLSYVKKCLEKSTNISIGRINTEILRSFEFKIDNVIENRIEPCTHTSRSNRTDRSVLFAGRSYMKGLPQIAQAVAADKRWKLILAGDLQLKEEALLYCPEEQVIYLGRLRREELLEKMHDINLVSVCSQYFDNYPTLALEALVHNSVPFTTNITGVASMLSKLDNRLVIKTSEIPNLEEINKVKNGFGHEYDSVKLQVSDLSIFVPQYLEIMQSKRRGKK